MSVCKSVWYNFKLLYSRSPTPQTEMIHFRTRNSKPKILQSDWLSVNYSYSRLAPAWQAEILSTITNEELIRTKSAYLVFMFISIFLCLLALDFLHISSSTNFVNIGTCDLWMIQNNQYFPVSSDHLLLLSSPSCSYVVCNKNLVVS